MKPNSGRKFCPASLVGGHAGEGSAGGLEHRNGSGIGVGGGYQLVDQTDAFLDLGIRGQRQTIKILVAAVDVVSLKTWQDVRVGSVTAGGIADDVLVASQAHDNFAPGGIGNLAGLDLLEESGAGVGILRGDLGQHLESEIAFSSGG